MKVCPNCGVEYADDQKFCPNDGTALRSTAQGNLIGSVIADRYHIVKKLGEGGMGAVYLGEHVKMGRKSAIKVMTQSMASDADAIARFNREAANAARINHPNVCAIYDFGETPDGVIYLAMEFIEGVSLGDVLDQEQVLPRERAVGILKQTADALQAAHDLGIVHRDLKPDNIMVARGRGGADLVKVVDFGIAKAMTADEGQKVTKTGLVVGTPEYMSPEQLSGDVLDGRSDIYSLALVFYRTLTGTLPFPADSAQEMMIKRLTDEPMRLDHARPGVRHPAALQRVVDRALARMPADRYTSAVQFAEEAATAASAGWGEGAPADAARESATEILGDDAATQQLAATEIRGAVRRSGGTVPPTRQSSPRTPTTPAPIASQPPPAKKRGPVLAIAAAVLVVGGGATAAVLLKGGGGNGGPGGATPAESSVTGDTARRPKQAGDSAGSLGGTGPIRPLPRPEDSGGRATPRTPDTLAFHTEITQLEDALFAADSADRERVMGRARDIYAEVTLPGRLRAEAARVAAQAAFDLNDPAAACTWIGRALALVPGEASFTRVQSLYGCGS